MKFKLGLYEELRLNVLVHEAYCGSCFCIKYSVFKKRQ
jgi:hypothetical protein